MGSPWPASLPASTSHRQPSLQPASLLPSSVPAAQSRAPQASRITLQPSQTHENLWFSILLLWTCRGNQGVPKPTQSLPGGTKNDSQCSNVDAWRSIWAHCQSRSPQDPPKDLQNAPKMKLEGKKRSSAASRGHKCHSQLPTVHPHPHNMRQ